MKKYSKKYRELTKDIDFNKQYSLGEAIEIIKKTSPTKFDATVEFHAKLGIDLKKPEQNVRSTVVLPKGTGKTLKILAFVEGADEKTAKQAGADHIGVDTLVEKIMKGWLDFDIALATPETMPKIAKVAKILGTKGLMPNPKVGTVTKDIAKSIAEVKKGKIEFRADTLAGIHVGVGKVSFSNTDLKENIVTLHRALMAARPTTLKNIYITSISLSSTMGPGVKIDLSQIK